MRLIKALRYGKPTRRSGWMHWCFFPKWRENILYAYWEHSGEDVELTIDDVQAEDWEILGQ